MTTYEYTLSPPSTDLQENLRLGYRTPRSILLPPYLAVNPYFVDFMNAIDAVFEPLVDQKTEIIGDLRNMWVTNPALEAGQIADSQMIPFEAWSQPERDLLVKQVNALGMKLQSAGLIANDNYQAISRWVGMYWFGKGTASFINFINYSLSTNLAVTKLWTQDYVNFVAEGDQSIGTPIWEGGPWYPTTHVAIIAAGGLQSIDVSDLITFFYEIANYNLVLYSVELSFDMYITDDPTLTRTDAEVVALGLWANSSIVMSNILRYGVDSPPTYNVAPDIPMGALTTAPTNTNYTNVYMLSQPSAWIQDPSGNKVPAYTSVDQTITNGGDLPSTLCGGASTNGQPGGYQVLLGPVGWMQVPGSSRSDARVPYYTSVPVARTADTNRLPSQIVGNLRQNLLVNPKGFIEMIPGSGQFTPYW
jgi:hypothetical protein